MRAGQLRQRITIQQPTIVQDTFGEADVTWSTYIQAWASIEPLRGREALEAMSLQQEVTHRVRMRHRDGVTPDMRISHDGRTFNIRSVRNLWERDKTIEMMVQENV